MDLGDLEGFRAAVREGSITRAARLLGCSQPALSRRVQRLEAGIGAQLLERTPEGVQATAHGELVLAFAEDVLDRLEALRAELRGSTALLRGTMRIAASTTPGEYLVPELLVRFSELHPAVHTEVTLTDSAAVPTALTQRTADVGFTGRRSPDVRLTHVPVARDEVVLAVPAHHPFARHRDVPLESLEGERLILREEGSGTQRTFLDALTAAGLELPATASTASLGSMQAVVSAVQAGLGIGIVSVRALRGPSRPEVKAVRVKGVPVLRPLWLVYETARRRPAAHAAFIAFASP